MAPWRRITSVFRHKSINEVMKEGERTGWTNIRLNYSFFSSPETNRIFSCFEKSNAIFFRSFSNISTIVKNRRERQRLLKGQKLRSTQKNSRFNMVENHFCTKKLRKGSWSWGKKLGHNFVLGLFVYLIKCVRPSIEYLLSTS